MRNLAQRSATAAKEIKTLIEASVDQVGMGARLVDQAGATMTEVVASVAKVSAIIGDITASSQAQSEGIASTNSAIIDMDEATHQNAALVEEAAAAAESLQDQARNLASAMGVFRLEGDARPARIAQLGTKLPARAAPPRKPKTQLKLA